MSSIASSTNLGEEPYLSQDNQSEAGSDNAVNVIAVLPAVAHAMDEALVTTPTATVAQPLYSNDELLNIEQISKEANDYFQPGLIKAWESKDVLAAAVKAFAGAHGFSVYSNGNSFFCTKSDRKMKEESSAVPMGKKRKRQSNRCGCPFVIRYTSACRKIAGASLILVRVTETSCFLHANGCLPGPDQLRVSNFAAGHYSKKALAHPKTQTLFDLMRNHQFLPARLIQSIVKPVLHEGVPVTAQFICNLRYKIMASLCSNDIQVGMDDVRTAIVSYASNANTDKWIPQDELPVDYIDGASRYAREVLRAALNESSDARRIEKLLVELHQTDKRFRYEIAYDDGGDPCGYVWQTPWQRFLFEQYGDVIFLDCMKRQQNSVDWPYIGPVVLDGHNKIGVAVEAICCSERLEAYEFVLNAAFAFSPGRPRNSVNVIFGDGIMSDNLLIALEMDATCKICLDVYHLLEVDWRNKFGLAFCTEMKSTFDGLVYSMTEEEYDMHYKNLHDKVRADQRPYVENEIHANRHKFSQCFVRKYEGNLRRKGDSPAEANHSSFVQRIGPTSSEEPAVAVVQMIERTKDMATARQYEINAYRLECRVTKARLLAENDFIRAEAIMLLTKVGFKLWTEEYFESSNYTLIQSPVYDGIFEVRRIGNNSAPPRLVGCSRRCDCDHRVSMLAQCRHELCVFGFRLDLFGKRHHYMEYNSNIPNHDSLPASDKHAAAVMEQDAFSVAEKSGGVQDWYLSDDGGSGTENEVAMLKRDKMLSPIDGATHNHDDDSDSDDITEGEDETCVVSQADADKKMPAKQKRPHNAKPVRVTYKMFNDLNHELWEAVKGRDDADLFCGVMAEMLELAKKKETSLKIDLEQSLKKFLTCFSSDRGGSRKLFSQTSTDGSLRGGVLAHRTSNAARRRRTTRLKPRVEVLMSGARQKSKCSFCKQINHRVDNCPRIIELKAEKVIDKTLENFRYYLGDPDLHQVLPFTNELSCSDWTTRRVPSAAVHVVLNAVYKNPDESNPQENIVDATFIGATGRPLDALPQCYKATYVREWITLKKSKTRMVFSKLGPSKAKFST